MSQCMSGLLWKLNKYLLLRHVPLRSVLVYIYKLKALRSPALKPYWTCLAYICWTYFFHDIPSWMFRKPKLLRTHFKNSFIELYFTYKICPFKGCNSIVPVAYLQSVQPSSQSNFRTFLSLSKETLRLLAVISNFSLSPAQITTNLLLSL